MVVDCTGADDGRVGRVLPGAAAEVAKRLAFIP